MRSVIVCIVAAILSLFAVSPYVYMEIHEEILCEICAIIDDSGEISEVKVTGRRFAPDAGYFTDIKILIDDGKEIIPETDEGYGAGVSAFDFKGSGYSQLFYYASSGGSGGFGYFYVFDCSGEKTKTVFDYKNFKNEYKAKCDGESVFVYRGKELFVTYDLLKKSVKDGINMSNTDCEAYVTGLNFVEPVFVYTQNYYRLNVWQNVIVGAQVNVVGRIITTMVYDGENGEFKQGYSSAAASC